MTALKQINLTSATPIEAIATLLQDDMVATNALILARMDSGVPMIPELAGYLIAAGGKRVRPLLTLAAAYMCGDTLKARGLAASVEFIHTATLLHDDVVDMSEQRRGKPAANIIFGNKETVLVGDFLFARAFELMVECEDIRILGILARASRIISEGEVLQMSLTGNIDISRAEYDKIIEAKTAALFSAATHAGALAAGADTKKAEALRDYGHHLGMAFQIIDDVLDYMPSASTGKNMGDDFAEGKITLPVLLAIKAANAEERLFWERTMHAQEQNESDLAHALNLIHRHDCLALARNEALAHANAARQALKGFERNEMAQNLDDFLEFILERNH